VSAPQIQVTLTLQLIQGGQAEQGQGARDWVGLSGLVSSVAEWACVGLYPVVSLAQGELDKYPRDEEGNSEQNTTYLQ